jgi:E3 ubiquitin-protein ligase HERC1
MTLINLIITRVIVVCYVGVPLVGNLRTRLLALHVLEAVLPACEASVENDQMTQVLELYAE